MKCVWNMKCVRDIKCVFNFSEQLLLQTLFAQSNIYRFPLRDASRKASTPSHKISLPSGGAQIFPKYSSHLNILGARRLTGSNLNTEVLQIFGDTVRNYEIQRNSALDTCNPVFLSFYFNQNCSTSATFSKTSQHKPPANLHIDS